MKPDIYLDYQATTPIAPEVMSVMEPWLRDDFANPNSPHKMGRAAHVAIEMAREQLVSALDAKPNAGRLIFTSGATEAANIAIQGAMICAPPSRRKIVTIATEHACVRDTALWMGSHGYECTILPVKSDGIVDLDVAKAAIDESTGLVAAMLVNNEIGVVQPISELSALSQAAGALFLCDAVQGFGRVDLPVEACDMITLSAHKIYGPKGVGALWMREGVKISPIMHGGGQEMGLRSGTLSPALCAGFGKAAAKMVAQYPRDNAHITALFELVVEALPGWILNGSREHRYKGNINIRRDALDVARLLSDVRQVAFSAGSACASGSGRPSHVLTAIGLDKSQARASIRLGFGRYTSADDIRNAIAMIEQAALQQGVG